MTRPLTDAAARRDAATRFDANIVVVAGAGTGKTSLLVERYLNAYLGGRVDLDAVVAITFTRKAAGELKVRLAEALATILDHPGGPTEPDGPSEAERSLHWLRAEGVEEAVFRDRARRALESLDGAAISTIHSFASEILRRHPVEAKLPPDYQPDEGEAQKILFEDLWPRFLSEELDERSDRRALWLEILSMFGQEEVEQLARALTRNPVALDHLARFGYRPLDPREHFAPLLRGATERLQGFLGDLKADGNTALQIHTQMRLIEAMQKDGVPGVAGFPAALIQPARFWALKESYKPREVKDAARKQEILDAVTEIQRMLKTIRALESRDMTALGDGLRVFAERFIRESSEGGALFFDDLLLRVKNLLQTHPGIRKEEAARARMLLLDEFQDTDPLQYELVFLLAGKEGADGTEPFTMPLETGRLFIVGDPKQSIYRFRGADIVLYERAMNHVVDCGGVRLVLSANFRSVPGVLEPLNALFETWMSSPEPEVEIGYDPIHAVRDGSDGPVVEIWSVETPDRAHAEDRRQAEANAVAAEIRAWHDRDGVPYRDIALLYRALTKLPVYTRALREAGIDYIVDGGKAFSERPEVVEALALLRALGNPADPVGTLGVLRSTLGGIPDADLVRFSRAGGVYSWRGSRNEALRGDHDAVLTVLDRLREMEKSTRRLPVDQRILQLLTEGDFPVLMGSFFEGAQRVANVRKLAHRAAELARDRRLSLEETVLSLEKDFVQEYNEGESPLSDEAVDAVRVLSVHAAKGLEFRRVLLPDMRAMNPGGDTSPGGKIGTVGDERRLGLCVGSYPSKPDLAHRLATLHDGDHDKAEAKRLLYVAATRARDRLILLNAATNRIPEWIKALETWGYTVDAKSQDGPFLPEGPLAGRPDVLHRIIPLAGEPANIRPALARDLTGAVRAFREAGERVGTFPETVFRTPSHDHRAERAGRDLAEDTEPTGAPPPELARAAGTLVHQLLEQWDGTDPEFLRERLAALVRSGAGPFPAERVREAAMEIVEGFLGSALPARFAAAAILGREVPILFRDEAGAIVHGYVDLVYAVDGAVRVADYKTDVVKGDPADSGARYRDQLADYAAAVQKAMRLDAPPVREVWFLRTGDRVEL